MATTAEPERTAAKRVPMDPAEEDRARRGHLLPDHLHLDPHARPLRPGEKPPGLDPQLRRPHCRARGRLPRGDRRPGRHRHRRHPVPGPQAAERRPRARLRHRPRPRRRHDLRRRRQPALAGDLAAAPGRSGRSNTAALITTGASHVAVYNWTFLLGQSTMPAINALLLGTLLYRSRLVPRALPVLGSSEPPCSSLPTSQRYSAPSASTPPWPRRRTPDSRLGVLPGRLAGRQGLQPLPHHGRNDRNRHRTRLPRRHRLALNPPRTLTARTSLAVARARRWQIGAMTQKAAAAGAALGDDLRGRGLWRRAEAVTDQAIALLAPRLHRAACAAAGVPQASWYRRHRVSAAPPRRVPVPHRDRRQPRALTPAERAPSWRAAHLRFDDVAPADAYATLLDEGAYLASVSTMYRILREHGEVRERRRTGHPSGPVKPELLATAPNQVWSWDITKLLGPAKWTYFYLYVILDVYSRYAVGWMVAHREQAELAESLIADDHRQAGRQPRPVDPPRRPRLLDDLQAGRLPARRPRRHQDPLPTARLQRQPVLRGAVQDPEVPPRLPRPLRLHRGGPGLLPGLLPLVQRPSTATRARPAHRRRRPLRPGRHAHAARAQVLTAAYAAHPERFVRQPPSPPELPTGAWINPPKQKEAAVQ